MVVNKQFRRLWQRSEEIQESSQIDKEFGDDKEGDKKAHIMKLVIIIHKVNPSVDEEEAMNYFIKTLQ